MGIGYQAFAIFDEILNKKLLKKCESVLETGSQSLIYQERAKDLLQKHEKKIINSNLDAKNFYFQIGFKNYKSIDADGGFGAIPYDLNQNLREKYNFNEQFDLVTNFGTSEHVFNQKVFFENVHNLTSRNGYMLHILPFEGHINHGYFNYNPVLFYELAIFNNYEIIDFWYFSEKPNARFKYYGHSFKPFKYNNGLIEELEKLCKKNLIQNTMKTNFSELAILYKKKNR